MKKFMLFLSVIMGQILFAGPQLAGLALESNTTAINLGESALLTVSAAYADGHTEEITDKIVWEITPADSAEIKGNILTAQKDAQVNIKAKVENLVSDALVLDIYWEVNGHKLPPEPDKTLNDSTLLGIDVNHNDVRDDVERWIYKTYDHPIERGIMLQNAHRLQIQISDISKAHQYVKLSNKSLSCEYYLEEAYEWFKTKYEYTITSKEVKKIQFNTLKRHMAYERYNAEFNGEIFDEIIEANKENCLFDENGTLKDL